MTDLIPPSVLRFIARHLRSLMDLEVLLLLNSTPDKHWNAAAVALQLGISGTAAREALENLCRQNLLDVKVGEALSYRYNPGAPQLGRAVDELVATHQDARVAVSAAVTDAARQRLRDFADAFRVVDDADKEEDDGG